MTSKTTHELLATLTERWELVRLIQSGKSVKKTLADEASISRPTVDRAVQTLEDMGLARTGEWGVELTPLGEVLVDEYLGFRRQCGTVSEMAALDPGLPETLDVVEIAEMDPEIVRIDDDSPHQTLSAIDANISFQNELLVVLPVLHPHLLEYVKEKALAEHVELLLAVPEKYQADAVTLHGERLEAIFDLEQHDVVFTETVPDAGYVVANQRQASIVVYDEGSVSGLVNIEADGLRDRLDIPVERAAFEQGISTADVPSRESEDASHSS